MNNDEEKKYNTIKDLVEGKKNMDEVKLELDMSDRQIYRLKKKFKEEGEKGFIHKSRGRVSDKKTDNNIIKELEDLYMTEYYDYSIEAFYEEIKKDYKISYSIIKHKHTKNTKLFT